MIEQQARVLRNEGTQAWVQVGAQSGCPACDAGKGCGAGIFGRLLQRRPIELQVDNPRSAQPGQGVLLGIPDGTFLRLVFRMYGAPLLAGLAGALLGHQLATSITDATGAIDAASLAAGVLVAWGVFRYLGRRLDGVLGDMPVRMLDATESKDFKYEVNCENR